MGLDSLNWMLVFVRASAFLLVLPIFSATNIPRRVRVALAAALALLIAPGLPAMASPGPSLWAWVGLFSREVLAGLAIGFVTRMVFYVCDFAGRLMTNEMGLNMASIFNPLSGDTTMAPGLILFYFSATVLMSLDLHQWVLVGFHDTYQLLPPGVARPGQAVLSAMIHHTGRVLTVGVLMAAPLMAVSFVILLVFSVLGRAVPQMSAFMESFAVRAIGGLIVFGLSLDMLAQHLLNYLRRLPADLLQVAQYLAAT